MLLTWKDHGPLKARGTGRGALQLEAAMHVSSAGMATISYENLVSNSENRASRFPRMIGEECSIAIKWRISARNKRTPDLARAKTNIVAGAPHEESFAFVPINQ